MFLFYIMQDHHVGLSSLSEINIFLLFNANVGLINHIHQNAPSKGVV